MFGEQYFYGKEVEGPLVDVDTVFVRTEIPSNWYDYPHIYFCISYIDMHPDWVRISEMVDERYIITLEVTPDIISKIPPTMLNRCRIMLSLDCPEFELLKQNDIVKIVTRPFTTYNVVKHTMQTSKPDDYKFDSKVG